MELERGENGIKARVTYNEGNVERLIERTLSQ